MSEWKAKKHSSLGLYEVRKDNRVWYCNVDATEGEAQTIASALNAYEYGKAMQESVDKDRRAGKHHVWMEGYVATGEHAPAEYMGQFYGPSFREACENALLHDGKHDMRLYDRERNTYWGMKFHDNEADARRAFG